MVLMFQYLLVFNVFLLAPVISRPIRRFTSFEPFETKDTANSPWGSENTIPDALDYVRLNVSLALRGGLGAIIIIIIIIWGCMHQSNKTQRPSAPRRWPTPPNESQASEGFEVKPQVLGNSIYGIEGIQLPVPEADGIGRVGMAGYLGGVELHSNGAVQA